MDYTGTIAYNVSRPLADILAPLVGKTVHHAKNSKDLVEKMKSVKLSTNQCLVSFDVVSLFTNTPVDKALEITRGYLSQDKKLKQRTLLTVEDIMELLEFVLSTTYFRFRDKLYKQNFGVAMGSPVSPIICNIFMEHLEQSAISSASNSYKPTMWLRYVDDCLAIIPTGTVTELNDHLNTIDEQY